MNPLWLGPAFFLGMFVGLAFAWWVVHSATGGGWKP